MRRGRPHFDVERFERVDAGPSLALLRVSGVWSGGIRDETEMPALVVGGKRVRPLPAPDLAPPRPDSPWRAAFSAPVALLEEANGRFGLAIDGRVVALPEPETGALPAARPAAAAPPAPEPEPERPEAGTQPERPELAALEHRLAAAVAERDAALEDIAHAREELERRMERERAAQEAAEDAMAAREQVEADLAREVGRLRAQIEREAEVAEGEVTQLRARLAERERELQAAGEAVREAEAAAEQAATQARQAAEERASEAEAAAQRTAAELAEQLEARQVEIAGLQARIEQEREVFAGRLEEERSGRERVGREAAERAQAEARRRSDAERTAEEALAAASALEQDVQALREQLDEASRQRQRAAEEAQRLGREL